VLLVVDSGPFSRLYMPGDGEDLPLKCRIQPHTIFHVVAYNSDLLLSMLVQLMQCMYGPLGVLMLLCSAAVMAPLLS
jgi:hypothetical protein